MASTWLPAQIADPADWAATAAEAVGTTSADFLAAGVTQDNNELYPQLQRIHTEARVWTMRWGVFV